MKYNWNVVTVTQLDQLEKQLEMASAKGWEIFSVLAVEGTCVIIARYPVPV